MNKTFYNSHIINKNISVRDSLKFLNDATDEAILFIVDDNNTLLGSLTDGDLRRGFIHGLTLEDSILNFMFKEPRYIVRGKYSMNHIIDLREKSIFVIPIVNDDKEIIDVINLKNKKSYLPVDALIMAGGKGERLRPLTLTTPKPMLKIGEKPIIEHNIDRLNLFGINDVWISVKYLGEQIVDHFKDGTSRGINISYINETEPLGTAGALGLVKGFVHDNVLLMNSDLLTNIDYEDFFLFYEKNNADLVVACIPYQVNVPYAVMESENMQIKSFKEKPTYTYYCNAGIYLMKKTVATNISANTYLNATDLMDELIKDGKTVLAYPLVGYWLDIGKHEDYKKAQDEFLSIKF